MNNKYELTDETVTAWNGVTLHRIKAKRDFANVTAGDLGGYIERESNLAVSGDARVSGDAHGHGSLYIGTLSSDECEQFEQAAATQGVTVRQALDMMARDYAQLHAPKSEAVDA